MFVVQMYNIYITQTNNEAKKFSITAKKASEEAFLVIFASDLSEENISIIKIVIAHKQIASVSLIIEVV